VQFKKLTSCGYYWLLLMQLMQETFISFNHVKAGCHMTHETAKNHYVFLALHLELQYNVHPINRRTV